MQSILEKIQDTVAYIRSRHSQPPAVGVVLGSGLGNFTAELEVQHEISYNEIPHFPVSTVEGHKGKLVFGRLGGKEVVVMAGRFHFYEGYSMEDVVYPIRVMKYLGIQTLILSNAAGGVNKAYGVGDLMIIRDHISQFMPNPLVGKNEKEFGPRFPDMSEPYDKRLIAKVTAIAQQLSIPVHEGVYVGVTGPTFETRAEYLMIHAMGGDAVGMSTVPEVITAVHMGLPVFAMSVITDIGIRDDHNVITHEEVLAAAHAAEPKMTAIVKQLVIEL
ncbi:MAG TPA: purine-nucleoside phosphorylase [Lacibacter sp.]|nr:purine-nucleoside phosphorylase [Lacibacter sp.]HMO89040.1 purine-nucleoside phosphorylase [Lacibacter sp.]HMP87113.1 purine-nucleoside phosphorylase [Lacibacter sp.]